MKSFIKYTFASILGFILGGIILFFLFTSIVSGMFRSSLNQVIKIESNTILKVQLASSISDRESNNPIDNFNPLTMEVSSGIGLYQILSNLEKAALDENIDGIYLNPGFIRAGMATLEEIRDGLIKFKKSGKFIIAYSDFFTQKAYYLASVADEIYMNPEGVFDFKGLRAEIMFYKGALDKLGVDPQIIRYGKFKSAVEPYLRENMSSESRKQIQGYINTIWNNMLQGISEERDISIIELNKLADDITIKNAVKADEFGFVDEIKYEDQVLDYLKTKTISLNKEIKFISLSKYSQVPETKGKKEYTRDRIALIYASGTIGMGEGREGSIGSKRISRAIDKAMKNSNVKAIVFRVNSGGGDVLSSEIIWRQMQLAVKTKPLIVSMGDYAASGAYYISLPAKKIIAGENTLTGSIGVFGIYFTGKNLINDKLGIRVDGVQTNKNSGIGSLFRPFTEYERSVLQESVDDTYDTFLTRVSDGRNMKKEDVDKIGQGRVWTGKEAKEIGLIDEYGGILRAIELAAAEAGLDNYRLMELPGLKDPLSELLNSLGLFSKVRMPNMPVYDYIIPAISLQEIFELKGLQLRVPYKVHIY